MKNFSFYKNNYDVSTQTKNFREWPHSVTALNECHSRLSKNMKVPLTDHYIAQNSILFQNKATRDITGIIKVLTVLYGHAFLSSRNRSQMIAWCY